MCGMTQISVASHIARERQRESMIGLLFQGFDVWDRAVKRQEAFDDFRDCVERGSFDKTKQNNMAEFHASSKLYCLDRLQLVGRRIPTRPLLIFRETTKRKLRRVRFNTRGLGCLTFSVDEVQ
jgi:hypothetical protein